MLYLLINTRLFTYTSESLVFSPLVSLSTISIISSLIIFLFSFQLTPKYIIELDKPSRLKSRKGTIKLGNIMTKNKSKYKFFLDISDLAQHMFVCGITGTGKSNFIQYFLLNFSKYHDLPFLLTEFKGEYQFLQRKIKDLLIIKPGENFSINIFDPEGADPEVHAESIQNKNSMLAFNKPEFQALLIDKLSTSELRDLMNTNQSKIFLLNVSDSELVLGGEIKYRQIVKEYRILDVGGLREVTMKNKMQYRKDKKKLDKNEKEGNGYG